MTKQVARKKNQSPEYFKVDFLENGAFCDKVHFERAIESPSGLSESPIGSSI
jgi:hypothetical protein